MELYRISNKGSIPKPTPRNQCLETQFGHKPVCLQNKIMIQRLRDSGSIFSAYYRRVRGTHAHRTQENCNTSGQELFLRVDENCW